MNLGHYKGQRKEKILAMYIRFVQKNKIREILGYALIRGGGGGGGGGRCGGGFKEIYKLLLPFLCKKLSN